MRLGRRGFRNRVMFAVMMLLAWTAFGLGQQAAIDLDGHSVDPLTADSGKIVVLVFIRTDCPVSSRYAPEIQHISKQYSDNARFWLVYPDKNESPQTIRKYLHDYGYSLPALRDPDHVLVRLSRVQITPEVAVFDRSHQLVYDGRIDDWYLDLGRSRPAPTTHELEDAIRATMTGKTMTGETMTSKTMTGKKFSETGAKNEVRGVGCYISDLD